MSNLPETSPIESAAAAAKPKRRRRLRRWLARAALAGAALVIFATALRLYFSDERLRQMTREYLMVKTGVPVTIERLQVSWFRGIEIAGFRLGAPAGFALDPVAFDRVALHWSLWQLARLHLRIDEIAVEGLHLTLEENERGRALDQLFAPQGSPTVSAPPPVPAVSSPPASAGGEVEPGFRLWLPIRVEVRRIAVTDLMVDRRTPAQQVHIDKINLAGRLSGYHDDFDIDLWLGLGDRDPGGAPAHLRLVRQEPPLDVASTVRLGVRVAFVLGDDTAGNQSLLFLKDDSSRPEVTLFLDSYTLVAAPYSLPPLTASLRAGINLDLPQGNVQLASFVARLGAHTLLDLAGAAQHIRSASPALTLDHLTLDLDLDELAPLVKAVSPGHQVAGRVTVSIASLATDLAAVVARILPTAKLTVGMEQVGLAAPGARVDDLNGTVAVSTEGDSAHFTVALVMAALQQAGQSARRVGLRVDGTTPVRPFVGGAPQGSVQARVGLDIDKIVAAAASVSGLSLVLDLEAPVALLLARANAPPLQASLRLAAQAVDTPTSGAGGVGVTLEARSWDLGGRRLDAKLHLSTRDLWAIQGTETMRLPGVRAQVQVARDGDSYDLGGLELELGTLASIRAHGQIAAATSPTPSFRQFELTMQLPSLELLLAALPRASRPAADISGAVDLTLSIDGALPQDEIRARLRPPQVDLVDDPGAWRAAVTAYADFITSWGAWFDRGLPGSGRLRLQLHHANLRDATHEAQGIDVSLDFELGRHGPHWRLLADVARVVSPTPVRTGHLDVDFLASGAAMSVNMAASAESLTQAPLRTPLTDAHLDLSAHYRLGGDAMLDTLRVREAAHGIRLDVSGVVTKPLAIALERGWEQPGMPGVDVNLRFGLGYGVAGELAEVTARGPSLAGTAGVDGTLRIVDGLVSLAGQLEAREFSYAAGVTAIEAVNGEIPFAVELYAGRRDDGVVVARPAGLGGGVLSLLVADDDDHARPARPAYFNRLRAYQKRGGLIIRAIRQDPYEIDNFRFDGRVVSGGLAADAISMGILGGDIVGDLSIRIARDASLRGDLAFQVSGIDASNFKLLHLPPGPDSELNLDWRLGFLFAPHQRDLTLDMNITKIGEKTLDRFLQLLDPEGRDDKLQSTRSNLGWVTIDSVAVWVRYENLNMDLAYSTKLRIPFTQIGYHPIPRELLRRHSLSELLDANLQPAIDANVAPFLGWTHAR